MENYLDYKMNLIDITKIEKYQKINKYLEDILQGGFYLGMYIINSKYLKKIKLIRLT